MNKYIYDESNGLWYELQRDYYIDVYKRQGIAENDRQFVCRGLCSFGGRDGNSETGKQGDKRSRCLLYTSRCV